MTKVLSGSLATGFISGNTTAMTFNAPVDVLKANSIRMNGITKLSKAGGYNAFLMLHNNTVYTCGGNQGTYNTYCLGRGTSYPNNMGFDSMRSVAFPNESGTIIDAGLSSGYAFAYALFANGNLYTWGYNGYGQCGLGHTSQVYVPTLAATGVTNVYVHPSNGDYGLNSKTIIRKTDGYLYATGYNGNGQLGLGDTTNRSSFTQITSLGTSILSCWNMGSDYGCIVVQKSDYTIWVAGYNGYGQLGTNDTTTYSTPQNVTTNWGGGSNKTLVKVFGGFGRHYGSGADALSWMGMLIDDGTTNFVRTAGYGGNGAVGNGGTSNYSLPQSPNYGTGRIADVAGGSGGIGHVHLLKTDGSLWAWGYNGYGQLGVGDTTNRNSPVLIGSGYSALMSDCLTNEVYCYYAQTFVRKTDGSLWSCGYNGYGMLGVGDTSDRSSFTRVLLPNNFITSDMGWYPTSYPVMSFIALSSDGRLYAWGHNSAYAISGEGYTGNITSPIQIRLPLGA